jgi:hypothetical protein
LMGLVEDAGGKEEVARKYARKAHPVRTKHFPNIHFGFWKAVDKKIRNALEYDVFGGTEEAMRSPNEYIAMVICPWRIVSDVPATVED